MEMDNRKVKGSALFEYEKELKRNIKNRRSIIYIQTDDYYTEEDRLQKIFEEDDIIENIDPMCNVNVWSPQLGKRGLWNHEDRAQPKLESCLENMLSQNIPSILIVQGLYYFFGGLNITIGESAASIITLLAEFFNKNEQENNMLDRSIIIIESPKFEIPLELKNSLYTIEPPYPDETDITNELGLDEIIDKYDPNSIQEQYQAEGKPYIFHNTFFYSDSGDIFEDNKKRLLSILKGMRIREIRTMLSYNEYIIENVNLDTFRENKERMVKDSGLLNIEKVPQNYEKYVGDIDGLIQYIDQEKKIIDYRINYNQRLPMPKGLLLVGPPGCGKSETSKAIASKLDMPLYSLDMGRLLGGLMGSSEHNFENAIAIAEAAQPCVLRIDEIEKAFAGSGTNENDQTLTHIVGFFLTWMQDRKSMVYIVATANNLDQLRPEFLRKGRWDEIFYLSYPKADGMIKIVESCLKRYSLEFDDIDEVRSEIQGFYENYPEVKISGAEIYDIIQQLYKKIFKEDPSKGKDIKIPYRQFVNRLKQLAKKDYNIEINKIIDIEILDLKKEYLLKRNTPKQNRRIRQAVENKYTKNAINKIINDELISIEISCALSDNNKMTDSKKKKIKELLETKYNQQQMIEEEISNIELNICLQNGILDSDVEEEVRRILKLKYKSQDSEEYYKAKGYKSASNWSND